MAHEQVDLQQSDDILLNKYYLRLEWRQAETVKRWTRRRSRRIYESDEEMKRIRRELERRGMHFAMNGRRIGLEHQDRHLIDYLSHVRLDRI